MKLFSSFHTQTRLDAQKRKRKISKVPFFPLSVSAAQVLILFLSLSFSGFSGFYPHVRRLSEREDDAQKKGTTFWVLISAD